MSLLGILFEVVGPVFLVAAIGYGWARKGPHFDTQFVGFLVNNIATPALILDSLLTSTVSLATLGVMTLAALLCMTASMALGYVFVRAQGLSMPTFLPTLVWANGGNMGLPLTFFAFGDPGLALAIAWVALSTVSNYTLGQAIAAGGLSFRAIVRMPIMWALLIAAVCLSSGVQLPGVFMRALRLLGAVSVPLMLLSLGHSLAQLQVAALPRSTIFSVARLCGGFAIGWGVATLLGLTGIERGVLVTQSAMPSAVLNYLFAVRYGNQAEEVAGIVVISTLMSVVLLPLFLSTVM